MSATTKKKKAINRMGDISRKNIRANVWGLASYLVDVKGLDEAAETADPVKQKNYKATAIILLDARQKLKALSQNGPESILKKNNN